MGHRRKSREYALQALYMYEMRLKDQEDHRDELLDNVTSLSWIDSDIVPEIRDFAVALIRGTLADSERIDSLIDRFSRNWKLERLSAVDKSILRLAIYEMLNSHEVPAAVTINEAIELGKLYSGDSSGQFINGILDAINKTIVSTDSTNEEG